MNIVLGTNVGGQGKLGPGYMSCNHWEFSTKAELSTLLNRGKVVQGLSLVHTDGQNIGIWLANAP